MALPRHLAIFKGPTCKGRRGEGKGRGRDVKGKGVKGMGGE